MGPGIIRHMAIWWSIARVSGIWHRLKYFDNHSKPDLVGFCSEREIGLLWPMDDNLLRETARHEAFHLSLKRLDASGRWENIDEIRGEAILLVRCIPEMDAILEDYLKRGISVKDEPLVMLADAMSDGVDLETIGASPLLISAVIEIAKPKPLMPALRAATHVLGGGMVLWAIIVGIIAGYPTSG